MNVVWSKQCVSNYYCGLLSTTNTSLQWKTLAHEFYLHSCTVRRQVLSFYFLFGHSCSKLLCLWWDWWLAGLRKCLKFRKFETSALQKIWLVISLAVFIAAGKHTKTVYERNFAFFFHWPNNYPLHFLCFESFSMTHVKPLTKDCQIVLFLFGCLKRESFSTSFILPDRLGIIKKKLSWFKPFPVFSMWVSFGA